MTHSQRILPSHQYIFYDDDIKDIEKSIRERTPEDDRISPDRQGPNTDPRDRSRTDYSRGNDRSPGRRWSGGGSGGAPGGRRPARGGIIRKPEELRDLPPPPEFRVRFMIKTLCSLASRINKTHARSSLIWTSIAIQELLRKAQILLDLNTRKLWPILPPDFNQLSHQLCSSFSELYRSLEKSQQINCIFY